MIHINISKGLTCIWCQHQKFEFNMSSNVHYSISLPPRFDSISTYHHYLLHMLFTGLISILHFLCCCQIHYPKTQRFIKKKKKYKFDSFLWWKWWFIIFWIKFKFFCTSMRLLCSWVKVHLLTQSFTTLLSIQLILFPQCIKDFT